MRVAHTRPQDNGCTSHWLSCRLSVLIFMQDGWVDGRMALFPTLYKNIRPDLVCMNVGKPHKPLLYFRMERYKLLPPLPKEPRGPSADIRNPRRHKPSASEPSASIRLNPAPPPKAHVKSNSDTSLGPGHGCRSNVSSSTTLVNGGMVPDHQRRARSQSCSQSRSRRARDALPEPEIDRAVGRKSVPESTMEAPIEELDSGVRCSTATELQGLWQAANGQRPEYGPKKFNLRFSR